MATEANKRKKSYHAFQRACAALPGGVNSPVRAFGGVDTDPVFIDSANGCRITDIDGNEYIDYVCSWGPMILGHCHPKILEAIKRTAEKGTSFGAPTLGETELAERIIAAFDSIERLRMVSSGTEAVMSAIRLARGHTGRDYILKMVGCYHGHSDCLLVAAGSGLAERSTPSSSGVPAAFAELTIAIPYNDIDAVRQAFKKYEGQIAAVLVEPVAANMGVVPPVDGYLQTIRQLCDDNKSLLIFDEVITGFRVAFGGAGQLYNITADLTCLGKIAGGGLPAAVLGGRKEIMEHLAPLGGVYQAGTLSGNPLAVAAANATLEILHDKKCYQQLEQTAATLQSGFQQAAAQAQIPVTINRVGSIMSCFFTDKCVKNFEDVQATDVKTFKKFFAGMLDAGVYLAPSAYEAMFVSLAHTKEDIAKTVEIAHNVMRSIK